MGQGTVPCPAVLSLSAINGTRNRPLSHILQYLETGEVDFNKALKAGIVNGITSGFAGVFGHVPGSILFASGVGAIEKVVGIVITLVNEIIADSSSAIISNGGN